MATFAERFKELRTEKKLTQQKLAEMFFANKSSISRYENNEQIPEIETLQKYANFFDVSVDYLLGISDTRSNFIEPNPSDLDRYEHLLSEKEKQEVESMANEVFNNFEFNAYKIETMMDPETNDKVKAAILDLCKEIKIKNKIKYNPNKNKNK